METNDTVVNRVKIKDKEMIRVNNLKIDDIIQFDNDITNNNDRLKLRGLQSERSGNSNNLSAQENGISIKCQYLCISLSQYPIFVVASVPSGL